MNKLSRPSRARSRSSASLRCWPAARRPSSQEDLTGEHPERLPPAPPDRGAREACRSLDRLHRRRPRHADADAARRSRRDRGELAAEATGGIVIEVPVGAANERAAQRRVTRNPFGPRRGRRARPRHRDPALPHAGSGAARHDPRQLSAHGGRDRPVRAVAERHRPDLPTRSTGRTSRTGITAAPRSAISPRRSPIRPIWCSRAPKRPCSRRAARSCSTSTARAKPPPRSTRMPIKARSAT